MHDWDHGFSMIAPPIPLCSAVRKLEIAGPPLLASRYQRFGLIARSFQIALRRWKDRFCSQLLTSGQVPHWAIQIDLRPRQTGVNGFKLRVDYEVLMQDPPTPRA